MSLGLLVCLAWAALTSAQLLSPIVVFNGANFTGAAATFTPPEGVDDFTGVIASVGMEKRFSYSFLVIYDAPHYEGRRTILTKATPTLHLPAIRSFQAVARFNMVELLPSSASSDDLPWHYGLGDSDAQFNATVDSIAVNNWLHLIVYSSHGFQGHRTYVEEDFMPRLATGLQIGSLQVVKAGSVPAYVQLYPDATRTLGHTHLFEIGDVVAQFDDNDGLVCGAVDHFLGDGVLELYSGPHLTGVRVLVDSSTSFDPPLVVMSVRVQMFKRPLLIASLYPAPAAKQDTYPIQLFVGDSIADCHLPPLRSMEIQTAHVLVAYAEPRFQGAPTYLFQHDAAPSFAIRSLELKERTSITWVKIFDGTTSGGTVVDLHDGRIATTDKFDVRSTSFPNTNLALALYLDDGSEGKSRRTGRRMLVFFNDRHDIDLDNLLFLAGGQSSVRAIQVVNMSSTTLPSLIRESMANPNATVVTKQITMNDVVLYTAYDHDMALVSAFSPLSGIDIPTGLAVEAFQQPEFAGTSFVFNGNHTPNGDGDGTINAKNPTLELVVSFRIVRTDDAKATTSNTVVLHGNVGAHESLVVNVGERVDSMLVVWNVFPGTVVHSMEVGVGVAVRGYADPGLRGESFDLTSQSSFDFNRRSRNVREMQSFQVVRAADLDALPVPDESLAVVCDFDYFESHYRNDNKLVTRWFYVGQEYPLVEIGTCTKVRIPEGVALVGFERPWFLGPSRTWQRGITSVPRDWLLRLRSLRVVVDENPPPWSPTPSTDSR
ncbi:hypothetical protein As57867_005093, partial [Aphanomyces stellatus]